MTAWPESVAKRRAKSFARLLSAALAIGLASSLLAACSSSTPSATSTGGTVAPKSAASDAIAQIVQDAITSEQLRAVIVKVTKDGKVIAEQAFGPSLDGVPATTDMNFRNGAVAFAYIGTLLMEYVDEHKVTLNDTIDKWEPSLPEANQVTLKMLANQTTGYPDFETDTAWTNAFNANPFHIWTYQERLTYAFARPPQFAPGTNWSYSHTNFMILGDILAKIGGKPLDVLLKDKVLDPMGLHHTFATQTSYIPSPVLHSFTSERRFPPTATSYEEATYWNTQWGTPIGANETTNIDDMITTAQEVGSGALLSKSSYDAMTGPNLLGFGTKQADCVPSCFTQIPVYNFGLGIVRSGDWLLQDPLLSGYAATEAYLPQQKIAIAVATTFAPGAFNQQGVEPNASDTLFRLIAKYMAPTDPTPPPPANG
ncbi:MAG TPA: serine hydrolase domain-containing protein [Acidimicrobiales bacterium]